MEGFSSLGPKERQRLREAFLEKAGAAFDQMFDPERQDQLVTFAQREAEAWTLGKKLTAALLEEHVAGDVQVQPSSQPAVCCPKCKQAVQRVAPAPAALPERWLTTRVGEIVLRREQWCCARCRIVFFSARPPSAVGDGGVQPMGDREGSASGVAGVVSGGE